MIGASSMGRLSFALGQIKRDSRRLHVSRFFREWWRVLCSFPNPKDIQGKANALWAMLPSGVLAAISGLVSIWFPIPWWLLFVAIIFVFICSLTAGIAWERVRVESQNTGPLVHVGPLELDTKL